ncbi:uncharacterized protein LOC123512273 [Portunus trituberculatus]|uniref:uncharacterized protein LOC123512273 n=1 Tax=Portunus trituberculatus TaxID=210409 RepID=UPI001E1CC424|nr:uncharacterized protein LOC123512273 [Portunus trituberculatus]
MGSKATTSATAAATSAATRTPPLLRPSLHRHLLLLLLSSLLARPGSALKWIRFHVPEWAVRGGEVMLTCQFDLAQDRLYSVKWYKAGREFYRYVPAEKPPKQAFPFKGVTVDTEKSNAQHVALSGVTLDTAGRYKCEVLTEAPLFKTLVKSSTLMVYELPDGGPKVQGGQEQYRTGEVVNLTCEAPKSIPATTLTWYINDQQAPQDYLVEYHPHPDAEGRVASRLGLRFNAQEWHFPDGRLALRCSASLHPLYREEAHHEGIVAPRSPLSLGHDASGCALGMVNVVMMVVSLLLTLTTHH